MEVDVHFLTANLCSSGVPTYNEYCSQKCHLGQQKLSTFIKVSTHQGVLIGGIPLYLNVYVRIRMCTDKNNFRTSLCGSGVAGFN